MNRDDVAIPKPCHADWEEMTGDERSRYCGSCSKSVHDLSAMTRHEALRLLDAGAGDPASSLCVRYRSDARGELRFAAERVPATAPVLQARGARQLQAAALLVLATGWSSVAGAEPSAEEAVHVEVGRIRVPDSHPVAEEEEFFLMGDVPYEPDDEEPCEDEEASEEGAMSSEPDAMAEPREPAPQQRVGRAAHPKGRSGVAMELTRQELRAAERLAEFGLRIQDVEFEP
jgi:hypothetical protein